MGRKRDIRQIDAIAAEFGMDAEERRDFGNFIEDCKGRGEYGSEPDGDFTFAELREKAREFRGER